MLIPLLYHTIIPAPSAGMPWSSIMFCKSALRVSLLVLFAALTACDSANVSDGRNELTGTNPSNATGNPSTLTTTSPPASPSILRSQAVDGYIVGGDVYCDDQINGQTIAAGWLTCAAGTTLISVEGGSDVGFDATATTGGIAFHGKLQGPGDAPYITPLTTVAVELSSRNGFFDRNLYDGSVSNLGLRLGIPDLDLTRNPATDLTLARANAQLNALAVQFATNVGDYETAMEAITEIIRLNQFVDLTDSVTNISAINEVLLITAPHLALSPEVQTDITAEVDAIISGIATAESIEQIDAVIEVTEQPAAFSISRTEPLISYEGFTGRNYRGFEFTYYTLHEFQQSTVRDGSYLTRFDVEGHQRKLFFHSDAFIVNRSLQNAEINVAVDVQSTQDDRRLSVTLRGVQLSMISNDSRSVDMQVPEGTVMHATYVEENGVVTNVSNIAESDLIASLGNGYTSVDLSAVEDALQNHGYANFLKEFGDYRVTVVLDGINFDLVDYDLSGNAIRTTPSLYTVNTAADQITGLGIQGYLSLVSD